MRLKSAVERLHAHVQPPSPQPYAVSQGKGSALADAVAAGGLGLHAAGACADQLPSGFPETPVQKRTEAKESFERYRDLILENIDYDVLASDPHVDREQLDEIVDLVQETVCSTRSRIRVAGNDYPTEVVRSKLLKLNSEHIRFVMDCLKQNTTRIRNIRQYLLTALFNAPSTMSSYYAALVAHDMAA